jgi:stalled ribosome rescue protein Dom34
VCGNPERLEAPMTDYYHAIVWIDHHEARVFHFGVDEADKVIVHPRNPVQHIHHKANEIGSGHAPEDQAFFHDVVQALGGAAAILLTGPANAKNELEKHIERHDPQLKARIKGIETLDHPSDGILLAHARKYFKTEDGMGTQRR